MPRLELSPLRQSDPPLQRKFRSIWLRVKDLPYDALHRYHRLGRKGKASIWILTVINLLIVAVVLIITPTRIGQWFNSLALSIKGMGWKGVVLCNIFAILSSHPPLFGFVPTLTLIGFIYGIWPGFLIAGIASMLGAGIAFLSVRSFFLGLFKKNDKWEAFGHVMRAKGLPLVIMIRFCPVPWGVSNGLFASIESVKFWHFMVANLMIQPKLLLVVFIGSRLTSLASDSAAHDPLRFWLNLISIIVSACISIATGVIIYRLTLQQMRKLDQTGAGLGDGELAAEALEENALLGDYDSGSGEDEAEFLTSSNHRDREGNGKGLKVGGGAGIIRRNSSQDTTGDADLV
ncbi:hypothetical protein CNBF2990 [Cryptococcus deneoformans B-3501A]|uniref:Golgi apparatus membrane protein TVP38 n=1 Tax=Cryptococcus deneoformans (strain JEC21 / ATCC MYA-565) TaxID=214684 RepID=Q5KFH6_CRYD1|nr:expressed protein [Cryptococcus neoformans var. neoformans JEC21]XP_774619.1 hypothetical protein CNBF2990 [Cryptococcus neoformans var. neoformans B-3501A]AAW44224.1 expressed protein [Cryptococcus neoformans var. neoformans JEC21]EAL19972.1 hypothetical protein CNBF2990 [Cryptococcus neoformans var. neoformans B-3501A]